MELVDNLKMYLRFAGSLRKLARDPITLEDACNTIKRRMAEREANFLHMMKRVVFGYAKSPYLPLLKLAGCEYGDLQNLVMSQGLEPTLRDLRKAGVYIKFEELKGRVPIVRGDKTFTVSPRDFENPYLKVHMHYETGGSTGVGRRIPMELDHQVQLVPMSMVTIHAHGCLGSPAALWRGPIPDGSGINRVVSLVRMGHPPKKWFVADLKGENKPRLTYRLADKCFVETLRIHNIPVPRHEPLMMDQALVLARWAHETNRQHGSSHVLTPVGRAMRVCLAAQDAGLDLGGTVFELGGEPVTEAKAQFIKQNGARYIPTYNMYEFGQMATGCANPACSDDVHMARDCFGLISHPIALPGNGTTVNALNITSLLPTAPLIMLNAQVDDHAVVEERNCGCPIGELGHTLHINQISSYSKLVTEGVSFVGSDVVRILEEVLPARFGGGPMDYQLFEEADQSGITRMNLIVSPRIALEDEDEVVRVFFQALDQGPDSYTWARGIWSQGQVLKVRRVQPITSARGKHLTLYRHSSRSD